MAKQISEEQKNDFHSMLKESYDVTNFDVSIGVDSEGEHIAIFSYNRGQVFRERINISSRNFPAVVSQIVCLFTGGSPVHGMMLSMAIIDMYQDVVDNFKLLTKKK